ncbi:hypothetical protein F2Q68_00036042 [Brassica cretica]|uniref:Uncharacterized protein n=1 Tax=Brassica cretica TaxID=69181 RepID=A0A8S9GW01_BRACR|nr:hypothetical protein F2Q68_00036042 [Brassica cretica]
MDWLKSVKSFIFIVHLHVQGNDNHHEGTDSLWLASPPIYQRRRFFSTRYESRAQPSFPWISSNPSTDLMIPRRTKEKSMKPSSSSSSSSLLCHPHPHGFQDDSRPLQCSLFMGLQRKQGVTAVGGEPFDIRRTIEEFKQTVYGYTLWSPRMEINVSHVMRRSLPSFVFPGGVRPLRNSKGTWDSKRSSEQRVSSTGSSSSTITSCESKGGKKRKLGDDETFTDQLRNSKRVAVSVHVENGEDGSPNSSVESICSAPMKELCTKVEYDPISKGVGESHPVEKIATPQASLSQESEEVEDNFGFRNQVVKQIPSKDAFSKGAVEVEELEDVPTQQPVVTHKASVQLQKPIIKLNFTSLSTINAKNLRAY